MYGLLLCVSLAGTSAGEHALHISREHLLSLGRKRTERGNLVRVEFLGMPGRGYLT